MDRKWYECEKPIWYEWGTPISEQHGRTYLTYKLYCEACREDGIEPVGIDRWRMLMKMNGIRIAPKDKKNKDDIC